MGAVREVFLASGRRPKRFGKRSPVFGMPFVHIPSGGYREKDSGELTSEIERKKLPPVRRSFCRKEQRWREYRSHAEPGLVCPDCAHELAQQAAEFQKQVVPTGNLPKGWGRTK